MVSLVNTIESNSIIEYETQKSFSNFYKIIDNIYGSNVGKNLLLLSSETQLNKIMISERPYFANIKNVDTCMKQGKCNISSGK